MTGEIYEKRFSEQLLPNTSEGAVIVLDNAAYHSRVGGLRDVAVSVPLAVAPGDTVTLKCSYNLEGDPLYTVKWYKGRQEFFRYVPKELPHTRVFPLPGVNVDVSQSGANQVVLRDVQLELAGKYRCEVSADAPTFHTEVVASHMHVVYLPEGEPKLSMEKHRYAVGDTLRGNCTSPSSNPPTNLTWFVNGEKMNESFLVRHAVRSGDVGSRQVTIIGLELDMDSSIFQSGRVEVKCMATMFQLYHSQAKVLLEEERPRLASVLGTRESSSPGKWPEIICSIEGFH
ncbi:synaptogenesis protein syg-2-like [Anabrus simplex]|uniref:synaptogenesis protein syg-2-like n=1 Tax=Anabrus simplex TaxID=316456 RepID=UPI0035A3630E